MGKKKGALVVATGRKKIKKYQRQTVSRYARVAARAFKSLRGGTTNGTSSTLSSLAKNSHDPFPPRMHCKLYYNDVLNITAPSTNLATEYIYVLNGLYDPDLTGTGHQPYSFDTCSLLYTNYMCTGCLVELEYFDPSADGIIVGYQVQGNTTAGFAANVIQERPWVESADIANTGNQRHCFRIYIPCNQGLGLRKSQYLDDTNQYGASVSANPTGALYLRLFSVSTQSGAATTIKLNVKLTFYSTFWNRVTQAQSNI